MKGSAALAAVLALGGSMGMYAWFTDSEGKKNKTTIAQNLDVEVVEPNFPAEGVTDVQPGQTIPKDPAVKNNSDTLTGWLFTEIRVPMAAVVVEGAEAAEKLPLFTFTPNAGWKQLQEFEDGDTKVYRFGWETTVEPGGNQTGNIFDEVTFVNLDGSAQGLALSEQLVKVIGYGIQDAEQFEGDVAKAWNAYKLQNGIMDGTPGNIEGVAVATVAMAEGKKLVFIAEAPTIGDELNGGVVEEVVLGVEHVVPTVGTPLTSSPEEIVSVDCSVPTLPDSTENWFIGMSNLADMNLTALDMTVANDGNATANMFYGASDIEVIYVGETTDIESAVPGYLTKTEMKYIPRWNDPSKLNMECIVSADEANFLMFKLNHCIQSELTWTDFDGNPVGVNYMQVGDATIRLKNGTEVVIPSQRFNYWVSSDVYVLFPFYGKSVKKSLQVGPSSYQTVLHPSYDDARYLLSSGQIESYEMVFDFFGSPIDNQPNKLFEKRFKVDNIHWDVSTLEATLGAHTTGTNNLGGVYKLGPQINVDVLFDLNGQARTQRVELYGGLTMPDVVGHTVDWYVVGMIDNPMYWEGSGMPEQVMGIPSNPQVTVSVTADRMTHRTPYISSYAHLSENEDYYVWSTQTGNSNSQYPSVGLINEYQLDFSDVMSSLDMAAPNVTPDWSIVSAELGSFSFAQRVTPGPIGM